ncbi:hypothetical protein [Paenibacillus harenae]|uniref:hypothetical protein n=1 Tax=Paenibacillus harenae TaxID=306543 RepID=UPI00041AA14E|nr:hypothetical protein [Paenibacillus harenae]
MSLWKGAWYLAKHELVKDRWKFLITLALVLYILLFSMPFFMDSLEGEQTGGITWASDFIYLSLLPCLGFVLNKTMAGYWKSDLYTKKLAQWRTMPISSKQIALGRLIQLTIVMIVGQLIFFSLQFLILSLDGADPSAGSFILYALFWFFYSLSIATAYVYWEVGHTGKMYFLISFVFIFIFLIISVGMALLDNGNIVVGSLHAIENGNWWIVLAALAVCAGALVIGMNRMEKRLDKRSYGA